MPMPAAHKKAWKLAKISSKPFADASNNANAKPRKAYSGFLMSADAKAPRLSKK